MNYIQKYQLGQKFNTPDKENNINKKIPIRYQVDDDFAKEYYSNWLSDRKDILQQNINDNLGIIKLLNTDKNYNFDAQQEIKKQVSLMNSAKLKAPTLSEKGDSASYAAKYSPEDHTISWHPNKSITKILNTARPFLHERVHAATYGKERFAPQIYSISKLKLGKDSYLDNSEEVYSRLMEFRSLNSLDPKKKYTLDDITKMRNTAKDRQLLNRYSDEIMLKLLNEIAYINPSRNKSNNYTLIT